MADSGRNPLRTWRSALNWLVGAYPLISEIFLKKPNWADTDGIDSGVMWCAFGGTCSRKEPIATDRPALKTTRCPGPRVPLPLPWGSRPGSRLTASWAPAEGARRNFLATSNPSSLQRPRHRVEWRQPRPGSTFGPALVLVHASIRSAAAADEGRWRTTPRR